MIGANTYVIEPLLEGREDLQHLDLFFMGKKSGQIFFQVEFVREGELRQKYKNIPKKVIAKYIKRPKVRPGNMVVSI